MKFKTRRFIGDALKLVGRAWEDVAQEVQEQFEKLLRQVEGGIPGGFNELTPPVIQAGLPGDPGAESSGWMSATARPEIATAAPSGLSNSNTEGSGSALLRASAGIKRDVRVFVDGAEVGTENALEFVSADDTAWTVVDAPGLDRVQVSVSGRTPASSPWQPDGSAAGGSGGFFASDFGGEGGGDGNGGWPPSESLIFFYNRPGT